MRKALFVGVLSLAVVSGTFAHGATVAHAGAPAAKPPCAVDSNWDPVRTQNAVTATRR